MPTSKLTLASRTKAQNALVFSQNALCKHVREDGLTVFQRHCVSSRAEPWANVLLCDAVLLKDKSHDLLSKNM